MENKVPEGAAAVGGANPEAVRKSRRIKILPVEFLPLPSPTRRQNVRSMKVLHVNNEIENQNDFDDSASMVSGVSHRSRGSKYSTASSRSQIMKKQLKVELDSLKRISEMENAVAMEKLAREKEIEKRRVAMEKLMLEENSDEETDEEVETVEVVGTGATGHTNANGNGGVAEWVAQETGGRNQGIPKPDEDDMNNQIFQTNLRLDRLMSRQTINKELPNFDGNPEEWPMFIRQYDRTTEMCGLSMDENMMRLQKCLKGKAREAVLPVLGIPEQVPSIIKTLELLFGRSDQIVESLVKKVRALPPIKESKPDSLITFANHVANLVATMNQLKRRGHMNNPTLMNELILKLSHHWRFQWCNKSVSMTKEPNLNDFSKWLQKIALTMSVMPVDMNPVENKANDKPATKKSVFTASTVDENACSYCDKPGHSVDTCRRFKSDNAWTRWKVVRSKSLCFICLNAGHRSSECSKKTACGIDGCEKIHHKQLHKTEKKKEDGTSGGAADAGVVNLCGHASDYMKEVLLRVVPVKLSSQHGEVLTYALLDEGSTVTMVDSAVAEKLKLRGVKSPLCIQWTNGMTKEETESEMVSMEIAGVAEGAKKFQVTNARTIRNLQLPAQTINMETIREKWPYLQDVPFSSMTNGRPLILIGSDNILLTTPRQLRQGRWNDPVATKTWLGWVVHGNVTVPRRVDSCISLMVYEDHREDLAEMVKESFTTESFGVKVVEKPLRSQEDERSWAIMESSTQRNGERFQTGLLWKKNETFLPESKSNALRRLYSMEKKMDRDEQFAEEYCQKIQDYLEKGYCRKLTLEEAKRRTSKTWFIPHFAVFNPNKPGKLRLVFDAAAKSHGVGLNDVLMKGPDLLNPLPAVLMRFRMPRVAIMGDVKEMFHQVKIIPEDVDSQRFLWRGKERTVEPEEFVMDSMIFGAACSPASAIYVKDLNAQEFQQQFPAEVQAIKKNMYMDDLLDGAETDDEAIEKVSNIIHIFKQGGFLMCNWASSSRSVAESLPMDLRAKGQRDLQDEGMQTERVLGLQWNPENDNFYFKLNFHHVKSEVVSGALVPTKREVLKLVMSLFDPLGFIANFVVKAKILFQSIWLTEIGWDDKIKEDQFIQWKAWLKELRKIVDVKIPRCYSMKLASTRSVELHTFVDASQEAFAAVSYLRMELADGVEVAFVIAKTRVAPIKKLSVPRLELQAAVMGSRLAVTVVEELKIPTTKRYFWSDSRTVLCWIRSSNRKFKQFVSHRIGEVLESTEVQEWRWVPTAENVADDATRSVTEVDFSDKSRWFTGPQFLKKEEREWPHEPSMEPVELPEEETKKHLVGVLTTAVKFELPDLHRFTSYLKCVRVTAWTIRFVQNFVKRSRNVQLRWGELIVEEIQQAEKKWWKTVQQDFFSSEISRLQNGNPVDSSSKLLTLSPYLDEDSVLRVRGRVERAELLGPYAKNPVILHPDHLYTKLLLTHFHEMNGHHGVDTVLNEVRQKYWVLRMRAAVKRSFYDCQLCKNRKVKPQPPLMGMLPVERLTVQSRPFTYAGVDFFGPMMVTVGRSHVKRYGVLFTCLGVRAVHLELAKDLSTDATLNAVRRFIARRGPVERLFSDNGTNFHGADNEIQKAVKALGEPDVVTQFTKRGIDWRFIPPGSPHMGGCWERLVKSVKVALAATLHEKCPQEDVLYTLLTEAEYLVNNRPLTHVSVDPVDPESLTPNHFLGTKGVEVPMGKFDDHDLQLRRQWRLVQRMTDLFWGRWVKEYLPTLTRRAKWHAEAVNLQVDDIVVVVDKDGPRNTWPLGRVVSVYPGKDGRVRVIDVKTKDGVYRRPVTKIAKLDVRKVDEEVLPPSSGGRNVDA